MGIPRVILGNASSCYRSCRLWNYSYISFGSPYNVNISAIDSCDGDCLHGLSPRPFLLSYSVFVVSFPYFFVFGAVH